MQKYDKFFNILEIRVPRGMRSRFEEIHLNRDELLKTAPTIIYKQFDLFIVPPADGWMICGNYAICGEVIIDIRITIEGEESNPFYHKEVINTLTASSIYFGHLASKLESELTRLKEKHLVICEFLQPKCDYKLGYTITWDTGLGTEYKYALKSFEPFHVDDSIPLVNIPIARSLKNCFYFFATACRQDSLEILM
jgi:hypothetical protein